MQITIDTTVPLTSLDRELLIGVLGGEPTPTIVEEPAPAPTPRRPAPTPTPEPEPEPEPDEDLIGGALTTQDAVDRATVLINSGGANRVKAALKKISVDRVSNIPVAKVQAFLDELAD